MPLSTTWISCQQLYQCGCSRLGWSGSSGALEFQDALTKRLQGADVGFDAGKGLCEVLVQESIDWLTRPLTRAFDQGLNFFEGQSQGTQVLDDLHTPECFFPKQTVVALAPAQGGEEPEALILAQDFDGHSGAQGKLPDGHRMRS